MEINENDYKMLMAYKRTLNNLLVTRGLCPECKQAILVEGQLCSNCFFDYSARVGSNAKH